MFTKNIEIECYSSGSKFECSKNRKTPPWVSGTMEARASMPNLFSDQKRLAPPNPSYKPIYGCPPGVFARTKLRSLFVSTTVW